ncbi:unnamed protein product, partial [Didymodactylos carnosus]
LLDLVLQAEVDRKDIDRKRVEHERAKKVEALTKQAAQQVFVAPQRQPNNTQGSTRNAQGHGGFGQGGYWRDGPIRGGYGRGNLGSWRNNYAQGGQGQGRYNQSAGQSFNGLCFRLRYFIVDVYHVLKSIFDLALVMSESQRQQSTSLPDFDRSLLAALWMSAGFEYGIKILLYSPPNPIEIKNFVKLKTHVEQQLKRLISIQLLIEIDEQLIDLLPMYEHDSDVYYKLC